MGGGGGGVSMVERLTVKTRQNKRIESRPGRGVA